MGNWAISSYISGGLNQELRSIGGISVQEALRARLTRMDGIKFFAFNIWRFPEEVKFADVDIQKYSQAYMQCAGSAKRMTVEVRTITDGVIRHVVLGKKNKRPKLPTTLKWEEITTKLKTNEVFTAQQAGELFVAYYEDRPYPFACTERELELSGAAVTE